jgi:hypothetical protein
MNVAWNQKYKCHGITNWFQIICDIGCINCIFKLLNLGSWIKIEVIAN